VPYRFVATATPSPNRFKELIHYAGFLGIMDTGQALTRFFKRDSHAGEQPDAAGVAGAQLLAVARELVGVGAVAGGPVRLRVPRTPHRRLEAPARLRVRRVRAAALELREHEIAIDHRRARTSSATPARRTCSPTAR
jgi:hypothetical protein